MDKNDYDWLYKLCIMMGCCFLAGLFLGFYIVGFYFLPSFNQYRSFTKAYNSRCDYYVECIGDRVVNVTLSDCIPLTDNFTCG